MPRKLTQEEFEEKVRNFHAEGEYIVLGIYINTLTPVLIKHVPCGREYNIIPHSFFQNRKCIECSYKINGDLKRKPVSQLQQDIDNTHGVGEYTLVGEYVNALTETEFFHKRCNEIITMSANQLLRGYGCNECARKMNGIRKRKSHKDYINEVKTINPNIIVLGNYIKQTERIDVKCNACGYEWSPFAGNLNNPTSPTGCPICANERKRGASSHLWNGGITNISGYLRSTIGEWKIDSFKQYNNTCILQGTTNNNVVHHIAMPFINIVNECFDETGIDKKVTVNEYTDSELNVLAELCLSKHYKYGLGVVVNKDLHKEFHDLYGNKNNTKKQFIEFALNKGVDLTKIL